MADDERTPTIDKLLDIDWIATQDGVSDPWMVIEWLAPALAAHDAEVARKAWWEGVQHQWKHRPLGNRTPETDNPYRIESEGDGA